MAVTNLPPYPMQLDTMHRTCPDGASVDFLDSRGILPDTRCPYDARAVTGDIGRFKLPLKIVRPM